MAFLPTHIPIQAPLMSMKNLAQMPLLGAQMMNTKILSLILTLS
jgi:hypothetical protein